MPSNTYNITVLSLLDSDEAAKAEENRIDQLINTLGQSYHGHMLLQHASETGLVFLSDPNEELAHCYPKEHDLGQQLGDVPVLRINPNAFEQAYRMRDIKPTQEQVDDIIISFLGHELRHNSQHTIAGPQYTTNRDAITVLRQFWAAEADAYAWQNLIEIELEQSCRPSIKKNNSIISPNQQKFYDAVRSSCDSNDSLEILQQTFEGWYIARDVYFNDYTSDSASHLEVDRRLMTGSSHLENIPLQEIISQYCQMPDGSQYVSHRSIQALELEALYNLPEQTIDVLEETNKSLVPRGMSDRSVFEIVARHHGKIHDYVGQYSGEREEVADLAVDLLLRAEQAGLSCSAGLASSPAHPDKHELCVFFNTPEEEAQFVLLAARWRE
jgi:hypothetical protein